MSLCGEDTVISYVLISDKVMIYDDFVIYARIASVTRCRCHCYVAARAAIYCMWASSFTGQKSRPNLQSSLKDVIESLLHHLIFIFIYVVNAAVIV